MVLCGLPVALFARPIMAIFTDVPEVVAIGVVYLWAVALPEPFMCLANTAAGSLRGAGDTRPALYYTMIAQWAVRLPAGYLLTLHFGYGTDGLWATLVLLSVVQGLLTGRKFRQGDWKSRRI